MQDLLMIFIVFLKLSSPQLKTNIFSCFEFKTEVFSTVICSLKNRLASYLSSRSGFHVLKVTSTVLLWIDQVFIFVPIHWYARRVCASTTHIDAQQNVKQKNLDLTNTPLPKRFFFDKKISFFICELWTG